MTSGEVPLPDGWTAEQIVTNITSGYAITYLFGLIGLIVVIKALSRFLNWNLRKQVLAIEEAGKSTSMVKRAPIIVIRAYLLDNPEIDGMTVGELHNKAGGEFAI